MTKFKELVRTGSDPRGQGFLEFAILITLVVLGAALALQLAGVSLADVYCDITSAVSGTETCVQQEVYCEDAFDTNLDGWQTAVRTPSLQNGQMCLTSGGTAMNRCSMAMTESDYVIRMNDVTLTRGDGYGIWFRSTVDAQGLDGYIFQYDPGLRSGSNPNGLFVIRRWINGREIMTPIASAPMSGTNLYNAPHDFEIHVQGNTYTVIMDGQQVLSVTDSTYPTGGVGLRTWDSTTMCVEDYSNVEP